MGTQPDDRLRIEQDAAGTVLLTGEIDPANAAFYQARGKAFMDKWNAAIANWEKQAAPLKGVSIVPFAPAEMTHTAFLVVPPEVCVPCVVSIRPTLTM